MQTPAALLLACSADPRPMSDRQPACIGNSGGHKSGGEEGEGGEEAGGDGDTAGPSEADGHGWVEGDDCGGEAEEGIPTDGAGCAQAPSPISDDPICTVRVSMRTRDLDHAGTKEGEMASQWTILRSELRL
jgi:hypothetical protein